MRKHFYSKIRYPYYIYLAQLISSFFFFLFFLTSAVNHFLEQFQYIVAHFGLKHEDLWCRTILAFQSFMVKFKLYFQFPHQNMLNPSKFWLILLSLENLFTFLLVQPTNLLVVGESFSLPFHKFGSFEGAPIDPQWVTPLKSKSLKNHFLPFSLSLAFSCSSPPRAWPNFSPIKVEPTI